MQLSRVVLKQQNAVLTEAVAFYLGRMWPDGLAYYDSEKDSVVVKRLKPETGEVMP